MDANERRRLSRDERVHRALANPVRTRLLAELRASQTPADARNLAGRLNLHVNTVRAHLAVLREAGLVTEEPESRSCPGRPRLVYRIADEAAAIGTGSSYRFLATILASYLAATAPDPAAAAEEAGAAWGRHLVSRPAPLTRTRPPAAHRWLVGLLRELGFDPQPDSPDSPGSLRILLRRCPFHRVASDYRTVVCAVHLGLMRGALAELGADVKVSELLPFVEPNLCLAYLEVPACQAPRPSP